MHKARAVTPRPDPSAGVAASSPARASPAAAAAAAKTFQFVTANPSTDAERSRNKTLVRSNASNYHWRRVRRSTDGAATSRPPVARRRSSTRSQVKPSKRVLAPATPQTIESSSTESEDRSPKTEDETIEFVAGSPLQGSQGGELVTITSASLSSLLVSGHYDPFETYPCDLPKEFVSPILDQVNSFLSLMFPPEKGQTMSPHSEKWLQMTFRDRSLFHASLFCQLTRNRIFLLSPSDSPETMQCYTETIRGVHQKFADTSVSCEDENILAVYALSYHGEPRVHPPTPAPSQGPLTTLQLLHLYGGRLRTVNVHLQGLAKMLTLRGGLSKLKLPGLAQAISFGDIILACQTLTKPMLPYEKMHDDVIGPLNAASRKTHPLVGLGRGFRILPELLGHERVEKLLIVLKWIIQYTFAVDDHVKARPEAQKLGCVSDERNFVQHSLLLLTPLPGEVQDEHPLIRLARLATVIYSLLVVFPLPAIAAPFHRLARDIQELLLDSSLQPWSNEASDLILWATAMGAIAAIGSPDRAWFCATLDDLTRRLGIGNWATMRDRLGMFLWYQYTNDSDGIRLWTEIEESNLFRVPL
ncbi:uncharacterized protein Z520_05646 [Fonsecaea multimorphosa CBS 102226]|uniref:Fungal-specific transcription factor domain-containing protein n=1 Tax=Fonsecaea multimorphosa CBS 102226 TaxID=1442371 RepID=A0A0D2H8Z9_9EURO|nr:uncharacterized protein Z520_05646 [Fonsecaea multimorphosa CBS 102226]KIX98345.1 hypothetical protein Z520_05646 [Fonsecaea multimorphosa CBS 102226]OAL24540.1 hypothetical protein AYO22_05329 [Fonsecaea multimorphosa]